jgi:hypothetical protein
MQFFIYDRLAQRFVLFTRVEGKPHVNARGENSLERDSETFDNGERNRKIN